MPIAVSADQVQPIAVAESDVSAVPKASAAERFLQPLNPMPLVHALFAPSQDPHEPMEVTFSKNVLHVLKDTGLAQVQQGKDALTAWEKGDHTSAVAHGLAALTPILGPISQQAADKFNEGDIAGGMGSLTSIALPEILHQVPRVAGAVKSGVNSAVEAAQKPGALKTVVGAGQMAGAPAALASGHPIIATGLAVRGLENIKKGMAERAAAMAPPAPEIPTLWQDLAKGFAGGKYENLSEADQMAIRQLAERMDKGRAAEMTPKPYTPRGPEYYGVPGRVAVAPEEVSPIAEASAPAGMPADTPAGNGGTHPANVAPQPGIPAAALESDAASASPPVSAAPESAPAPPQPNPANHETLQAPSPETTTPPRVKGAIQGGKDAKALTAKLLEWKMTPDEVHGMNEKGWVKLAFQSGVPLPSKAVRQTAIINLKHALAGPPVTIGELMERFRNGYPKGMEPETAEPSMAAVSPTLAANPKALAAAQALGTLEEGPGTMGEIMNKGMKPPKRKSK